MKVEEKDKLVAVFYKNFIGGVVWIAGVTIGFTFLVSLLSFVLGKLGGLPLVGDFFASIVSATQKALENRTLIR